MTLYEKCFFFLQLIKRLIDSYTKANMSGSTNTCDIRFHITISSMIIVSRMTHWYSDRTRAHTHNWVDLKRLCFRFVRQIAVQSQNNGFFQIPIKQLIPKRYLRALSAKNIRKIFSVCNGFHAEEQETPKCLRNKSQKKKKQKIEINKTRADEWHVIFKACTQFIEYIHAHRNR